MRTRSKWILAAPLIAVLLLCACQSTPKPTARVRRTYASPTPGEVQETHPTEAPFLPVPSPVSPPTEEALPALPGITALEGLPTAEKAAKDWKPNHVLYTVAPGDETIIAPNGRSQAWSYFFIDSKMQPGEEEYEALKVAVGPRGLLDKQPTDITFLGGSSFEPIPLSDWTIDTPAALSTAEARGGAAFREKYPDAKITASLGVYREGEGAPSKATWSIIYYTPSSQEQVEVSLDAAKGRYIEKLSHIPEWVASALASEQQPFTAREGYAQAEQAARDWSPNATLVVVALEPEKNHTIDQVSRAPLWVYTFMGVGGNPGPDGPAQYEIKVDAIGFLSARATKLSDLPGTLSSLDKWVIDSPAAVATAEANGGMTYREKCPDYSVHVGMILAPLTPDKSHPAVWVVQYRSNKCGSDYLAAVIDASTGEFIPSMSHNPESIERPPSAEQNSLTAMEGLKNAIERAQGWQASAALDKICGDGVSSAGKSTGWSYTFLPSRGDGEVAKVNALVLKLEPDGTWTTSYEEVNTHVKNADWTQLKLDSPSALQIAEDSGGKDLRANYSDTGISICLEMESYESQDTPALWNVHYADPARNVSRNYFIEDSTGQIRLMRNELLEQVAAKGNPISERVALETGQRYALAWDPQAMLGRLYTGYIVSKSQTSPTVDGKAPIWGLVFIAPLNSSTNGTARVLWLYISEHGVESYAYQEMIPDYEPVSVDVWTVDTLQAITLAEANSGQNFRAADSGDTRVSVSLQIDREYNLHRLVWVVTYTNSSGTKEFIIDAMNGDLINP